MDELWGKDHPRVIFSHNTLLFSLFVGTWEESYEAVASKHRILYIDYTKTKYVDTHSMARVQKQTASLLLMQWHAKEYHIITDTPDFPLAKVVTI